jgi:phage terminase large subunit-like protein
MYVDLNPPDKGHWTYKLFKAKIDPESKGYLPDPENYAFMQLNPRDNQANLSADYIKTLESLPLRLRKRFLDGEFRDQTPNALFIDENLERWRLVEGELPDMLRLVVAVDPSGAEDSDNIDNDEIGISVCGLGVDGNGYVLQDLTLKAGPATWGRVAVQAYIRQKADRIVGEVNYGGAMVAHVIRTAALEQNTRVPFRSLTASRGKVVRAEPIAALFETGKCRIVGYHRELEDELSGFTTYGFTGDHSPNRADAMIWAMSDLFPELMKPEEPKKQVEQVSVGRRGPHSWMRV